MPFLGSIESSVGYGRVNTGTVMTDKIAASLTTSLAAYNAASNGTWIKITSTEYTNLQTNVSGTSVAGLATTNLNGISTTNFTTGSLSFCNISSTNTPAILANQYVYAFACYTGSTSLSGIRVYANSSTSTYSGFTQIGGTLPATSINSRNYYVCKGISSTTAATAGLLAVSTSNVLPFGFSQTAGGVGIRNTSTVPLVSGTVLSSSFLTNSSAFAIQCLTTGTIQW